MAGKFEPKRPVIFLDRDGVINKKPPEGDYVKNWGEFEFLPGAPEAIQLLTRHGYEVFIITNQAGIGRRRMSQKAVGKIHQNLMAELGKRKACIKDIYFCPHTPEEDCSCRKPKPGLLLKAAQEHQIDLSRSILIGDQPKDMEAGRVAGCKTIQITNGRDLLAVVRELLQR